MSHVWFNYIKLAIYIIIRTARGYIKVHKLLTRGILVLKHGEFLFYLHGKWPISITLVDCDEIFSRESWVGELVNWWIECQHNHVQLWHTLHIPRQWWKAEAATLRELVTGGTISEKDSVEGVKVRASTIWIELFQWQESRALYSF